jgi:hypothetical protein
MKRGLKKIKFSLALFLYPVRPLLEKIGIRYDLVKIGNDFYREEFCRVPAPACAVILPHCLIHEECPAKFSKEEGVLCIKCRRCKCGEIKSFSEERGLQFFITPSVGFTKRLAERKKIRAAVGATCIYEIKRGLKRVKVKLNGVTYSRTRIIPQMVMTAKYDCTDNDVNWDLLKEIILSRKDGVSVKDGRPR